MGEVDEYLDPLQDDIVRTVSSMLATSDATPVVFVLGRVKPLSLRKGKEWVIGLFGGALFHRIALRALGIGLGRSTAKLRYLPRKAAGSMGCRRN